MEAAESAFQLALEVRGRRHPRPPSPWNALAPATAPLRSLASRLPLQPCVRARAEDRTRARVRARACAYACARAREAGSRVGSGRVGAPPGV